MQFVAVGPTVLGGQFLEAKHPTGVLRRNGIPPITIQNHRQRIAANVSQEKGGMMLVAERVDIAVVLDFEHHVSIP